MNPMIDLNADMGEGFGRWPLGDDAALMPHVTSANIACGFHAGDPHIMRECVRLAVAHGVGIGAHVGFADLAGFGRRALAMSAAQMRDMVLYQIGALAGFAAAAGRRVAHVKPHSALYRLCIEDPRAAAAVASAMAEFDRELILISSGPIAAAAAAAHGLRFANEVLIDLEFDTNGSYIPEWPKRSWPPELVARNAAAVVFDRRIHLRGGGEMTVEARTLCVHGDADNAALVAKAVRTALDARGVVFRPLSALSAP